MPIYDLAPLDEPDYESKGTMQQTAATQANRTFAAEYMSGGIRTPGAALAMTIGGSVIDLVDTAASSVIPGVEREDVNETFLGAIGSPGLNRWYTENKGAIEVGSGIAGIIASDIVARRVLAPAGLAMRTARKIPWINKVAQLDAQYAAAVRVNMLTNRELARRGATGVERFIGTEMNLAALGARPFTVTPRAAAQGVRRAAIGRGLVRNLTTEGVMAATLHTNAFLYDDELSHNLAWGLAGLGIGGTIDNMVASYTLRRAANSAAVRRLNAGAYDPSGKEGERLNAGGVADAITRSVGGTVPTDGSVWSGSGAVTDRISSTMIQARELTQTRGFTERAMSLFRKREAIATPFEKQAFEDLNKVTVRGLAGVSRAGFGTKAEGLGNPLMEALHHEPAFLYGIEEIGTEVEELGRVGTAELRNTTLKNRLDHVSELLTNGGKWKHRRVKTKDGEVFQDELIPLSDAEREALEVERKELEFKSTLTPVTMLETGEWAPISHGAIADGYTPRQVLHESIGTGEGAVQMWSREKVKPDEGPLGIRNDGELFLPGNGKIEKLELPDMLHLYHAGNRMVRDLAASGGTYTVPRAANWFQLDIAEQLLRATDNPGAVVFPPNMTRETAMVESYAQKVAALKQRSHTLKRADALNENQVFQNKVFFNLPRLTSYQAGLLGTSEHPFDILTNAFKSADEVRQTPYVELLKGMNDSKKIAGLTDDTVDQLDSLQGNSFNFLITENGVPIKPIIGYKRQMAPYQWSQGELLMRQATNAMYVRDKLLGETADAITREIVETLTMNPAFAEAGKVAQLADDQHRSMVPGFGSSAPQTTQGSLINAVTSRERRDVDSMVMLAASKLKEDQSRVTQELMRRVITGAMGDSISLVNSPRNITSKLGLNQFHSFRQGWELAREVVEQPLPNGKKGYAFVLDHESLMNQKRYEQTYGQKLNKGQTLLNPDGQTIVLDELALDTLKRMQGVHEATLAMKNTLLRSQGLSELKSVPWYAPPPNTQNKYIGYTFDARDNVVPGMTIVADSPEELSRMERELVGSKQWRQGYTFRQRNDVESFMDLWDKAQMDYIAPNTTAIQPKKHNYGRTGGNKINTQAFEEALVTMRDSMVSHGDDIMEVLFREQLKSAKARASISRVEAAAGSRSAEQHSSIFDRYIQNLTGKSSLGAKDSFFGWFMSGAERRLNGMLASDASRSVADTYQSLKDYLSVARPGKDKASIERFKKLSSELGQYMPYKSTMEMVERETGSRTPTEVAAITSKLSWFEAASRLRWLESFHAVANIGGILSNTSSVIRALQPMAGETLEEAALRNSSLSMMMATKNGHKFIIPHTTKLLFNAMKDAWKKVPDEFTERAIRMGYMDQEVAEFNRQWGAIDSKDGWRAFVFGNEQIDVDAAKGVFGRASAKVAKSGGLDKWMAILSDKSEAFTRQWGMYAGKRVAESMGIKGVDDQLAFAHDLTNKLIANYDPRNRPEIFQGALGAPAGLFQSYAINYYQRMFRYLETGNSRAIATQYATQSAVFGISSVPGWDAFNWAFFDHGQAENDEPVDSLYKRFGQIDGDLLMHGTISNLPKLFGADGVSLYTRGDSAIRMPVVNLPVADTIGRIWGGLSQGIDSFAQTGGIGGNQLAEILSNVITNRPLAGMLETFGAHGYDTSFDAQVVSEAHGLMDNTYRVLGVKAMQQQKETELFYANRNAQEEQNARKDTLRAATRAAIRDQRFDDLPGLYARYVEQGGDPRYYSRWVKESFRSALDTRGERMLEEALKDKDGSKNAYVARLLDAQVGVGEDEQNGEDYGYEAEQERVIQQGWETQPLQSPELEDPFAVPEGGL